MYKLACGKNNKHYQLAGSGGKLANQMSFPMKQIRCCISFMYETKNNK